MMDWNKLHVGKRVCRPGLPSCSKLDVFPFGLFLMVRLPAPNRSMVHDYDHGQVRCRAVMADGYLAFLYQIGMRPWRIAIFHMARAQYKHVPPTAMRSGLPLHLILVDAQTGVLRAKRIVRLSPELSMRLVFMLSSQDVNDPLLTHDIRVRHILHKHSISEMVAMSTIRWSMDDAPQKQKK